MAHLFILTLLLLASTSVMAQQSRGLAAMAAQDGGVYLSWRFLPDDPPTAAFDLYREGRAGPEKLNPQPLWRTTDFVDATGDLEQHDWYVVRVDTGARSHPALEAEQGVAFAFPSGHVNHGRSVGVADLDGDGRLDFTLRHSGFNSDPYHRHWQRSPKSFQLTAFTQTGKSLWTYDMGRAIEMGVWFAPYVVHDLDGDGRAELVVKAGDESVPLEKLRDESGRVMYGPEYLRVVSGTDGNTILAEAPWPSRAGYGRRDPPGTPLKKRLYEDYNRWSRNFIGIAYLDGRNPFVIVNRGTYDKHKVRAYRYREGQLELVWQWENVDPNLGGDPDQWGQGAHALQAVDVDADGRDEVVIGSLILDDDGRPLRTVGHGHREHVDHVYIGDLDPLHNGLEMYYGAEWGHPKGGFGMIDLATGRTLWQAKFKTRHVHDEGMCADIDARYPGVECYGGEANRSAYWLHSAQGDLIDDGKIVALSPEAAWWDADAQKEIVENSPDRATAVAYLSDYPERQLLWPLANLANVERGGHKQQSILAVFDVLGDWREEIVVTNAGRLLIYMSNIPATARNHWLMSDHTYRLGVVNTTSGYYQQPMYGPAIVTTPPALAPVLTEPVATDACRPIATHCFPRLR